jgi:futalosine hydrolase
MPRHLILIPTDLERRVVAPLIGADRATVALCGFGIAAAAARTAQLVAAVAPEAVVLVGIAGRLDDRLPLGAAACFGTVACDGIGIGSGDAFVGAAALGWPQWPGDPPAAATAIGDVIDCAVPARPDLPRAALLVTAAAGSADSDDATRRRRRFPGAAAEDMEGFAVALACRLAGVPCTIIRGISNTAGDRDHARWRTSAALEAAAALVGRLIAEDR